MGASFPGLVIAAFAEWGGNMGGFRVVSLVGSARNDHDPIYCDAAFCNQENSQTIYAFISRSGAVASPTRAHCPATPPLSPTNGDDDAFRRLA